MAELPSGTVTFLFTDIEGSTRLWEDHPDAMRDALARHDDDRPRCDRRAPTATSSRPPATASTACSRPRTTACVRPRDAQSTLESTSWPDGVRCPRADGCAHGRGAGARRRLLRAGSQPGGAVDGPRPRRPDRRVGGEPWHRRRFDGRRVRARGVGRAPGSRCVAADRGVPTRGSGPRPRLPAAHDGSRVHRQPPRRSELLRRSARGGGRRRRPARRRSHGHAHRRRGCRQDAHGPGGRGTGGARLPRWRVGRGARASARSRHGGDGGLGDVARPQPSRARSDRRAHGVPRFEGDPRGARQLRAPARRGRTRRPRAAAPVRASPHPGDEP